MGKHVRLPDDQEKKLEGEKYINESQKMQQEFHLSVEAKNT